MPRYESPYDPSKAPSNLEHVIYRKKDHVAYVTINRPDVLQRKGEYPANLHSKAPLAETYLLRCLSDREAQIKKPATFFLL